MKKKNLTLFLLAIFFVMSSALNAVIWVNDIVSVFPEEKAAGIETLVTEGSALYFKANADIMNFCAGIEIAPTAEYECSGALSLVQSAQGYLKESREKYLQAAQTGIAAGYVQSKRTQLISFDFDRFAEEQELNGVVKERVKGYLANGDVTGFYQATADGLEELTGLLEDIEKSLQSKTKPQIPLVWKLLQKLSELTLFGNLGTVMAQTAIVL